MMPTRILAPTKSTPIEELRKPHPEQKRIDAESAALLRATATSVFRRMAPAAPGAPSTVSASRIVG